MKYLNENLFMFVFLVDYFVKKVKIFCNIIKSVIFFAEVGNLVFFGIKFIYFEMGYGYI